MYNIVYLVHHYYTFPFTIDLSILKNKIYYFYLCLFIPRFYLFKFIITFYISKVNSDDCIQKILNLLRFIVDKSLSILYNEYII